MQITLSKSERAQRAKDMLVELQKSFVNALEGLSGVEFEHFSYQRDSGRHGGGERFQSGESSIFNRASVNFSHIQYDDDPERALGSATALSTIIHPNNPHAPSIHMHISWTEFKNGHGYWRMMADLNPSLPYEQDKRDFEATLRDCSGALYERGAEDGTSYFYIPALGRHRGITHFYLEEYASDDEAADLALAQRLGEAVTSCYISLVQRALAQRVSIGEEDQRKQLDYHTVYFFQVLTLDRGTTAGLLVHAENDVGVLGSLPARVDRSLLAAWREQMPVLQRPLLDALLGELDEGPICRIEDETKSALANALRHFYKQSPEALDLQASGSITPRGMANHR